VRVRVKSQTMAMLGEDSGGGRSSARRSRSEQSAPQQQGTSQQQAPAESPAQGAAESLIPLPNPAGVLKGLFGR